MSIEKQEFLYLAFSEYDFFCNGASYEDVQYFIVDILKLISHYDKKSLVSGNYNFNELVDKLTINYSFSSFVNTELGNASDIIANVLIEYFSNYGV